MIRTLVCLVLPLTTLLAGCKATETLQDTAQVRVLHVSPDTEAITIKVKDGDTKTANVPAGGIANYVSYKSAATDYEIRSATDGSLLQSRNFSLTGGGRYTLVVSGRRAALASTLLQEDTVTPASGKFRFRADNFANLGGVDIYFVSQVANVATEQAKYYGASPNTLTAYTEVSEGDYQLVLTLAGTKDVVFEAVKQRFAANTSLTMAVTPGKSARLANVSLLTYGDSGAVTPLSNLRARIRAIHASPDSPLLAFKSGGNTLFSNVPYKGNSSYALSASGEQRIDLEAFGITGSSVASKTFTLGGGEDYTLIAANRFGAIELVKLDDNNLSPAAGKVRVRFANMNPDNPTVDVLANFSKTFGNLAYKAASTYVELDAGSYTFAFNTSNANVVVASSAALDLESGKVYTLFLLGISGSAETKLVTDN